MSNHALPGRPDTVYYFPTCLVDLFYPEAGMAGIELLRAPARRSSCPATRAVAASRRAIAAITKKPGTSPCAQIKAFPKNWPIVVPSGSCAGMMKTHYPELFTGMPELPEVAGLLRPCLRTDLVPRPCHGHQAGRQGRADEGHLAWFLSLDARNGRRRGAQTASAQPGQRHLGRSRVREGMLRFRRHLLGAPAGNLRRHGHRQGQQHHRDRRHRGGLGRHGLHDEHLRRHEEGQQPRSKGRHIAEFLLERIGKGDA